MSHGNRIWHILLCLVACIAEHHTLVACTNGVQLFLGHTVFLCLKSLINTHSNVGGLLVNGGNHAAGITVKTIFCTVIANLANRLSYDLLDIYICLCRDLAHNQHQSCGGRCLAGNTAHGILLH